MPPNNNIKLNRVAKWTGASWAPLGGGFKYGYGSPWTMYALAVFDDGNGPALYAAGDSKYVWVPETNSFMQVNNIAKWNGTEWSPVGGGTTSGTLAPIYDLVVFDDGTGSALYAGGDFNSAGGVTGDADAAIHALTVLDDGTGPALYAGGRFTNAGGVSLSNIAKWNGTNWSPVGSGFDDTVRALSVHEATGSPNLLIEGTFQFDFSTLSDGGGEYAVWSALPCPLLVYTGLGPIQGSMLHVPAGGSLRLGEMEVVTPSTSGAYKLDVASPYGTRGGSIISFGFGGPGDPYTDWFAESGDITGDPFLFSVQTGPPNPIPAVSEWGMVVIVLLLLLTLALRNEQALFNKRCKIDVSVNRAFHWLSNDQERVNNLHPVEPAPKK